MAHKDTVQAVAFSPDGRHVLTGSKDGTARFWDAADGRPFGQPMAHKDAVQAVAFSPDGRHVLTGSLDRTAQVWDAANGRPVGQPMVHGEGIAAVAFSPGDRSVLTAGLEQSARLWVIPTRVEGDPEQVADWVRVLTGQEFGPEDTLRMIDVPAWRESRRRLSGSGYTPTSGGGPRGQ